MLRKSWFSGSVVSALVVVAAAQLWAFPEVARKTKTACASCHSNPVGGIELTDAGKAYKAEGKAPAAAAAAKKIEYVGSAKCRVCHMKQHKAWAETPHAKSMINLQAADEKVVADLAAKLKIEIKGSVMATDDCVKCHVTGFQLAGGYPAADSAKTAAVANVGCETCHGPGSTHVTAPMAEKKKTIGKGPTASLCVQCHTPAVTPKFQYEEFVKRVHPVAKTGG